MLKLLALLLVAIPLVAFGQSTCNSQVTGSDEGARIDQAIAACPNGCTIQIPSGTYSVTTPITVCNPNIKLVGGGQGNTTLVQNFKSVTNDFILVSADGFDLSGFTLNGGGQAVGGNLLHILQANQAKIHDNIFMDPRVQGTIPVSGGSVIVNGVRIEGTTSLASNYNQVINNSFTVPTIAVSVSTNANVNNIQANQFVNCFTAFDFNGDGATSTGNSFSNNIITGGSGGNYLQSVSSSVITGNQFLGAGTTTGYTLNMTLALGTQQATTVISNNVFLSAPGGALHIFNNVRDTIISGNLFFRNGTDGIFVENAAGAVTNLSIQSNIFRDNGLQNGAAGFGAIRVSTTSGIPVTDWIISNNTAYDDQASQTQAYGLLIFGGGSAVDLTMLGNDFARSKTAAIAFLVPVSTSSIGPNRESTAGGWVYRDTTGVVTTPP